MLLPWDLKSQGFFCYEQPILADMTCARALLNMICKALTYIPERYLRKSCPAPPKGNWYVCMFSICIQLCVSVCK